MDLLDFGHCTGIWWALYLSLQLYTVISWWRLLCAQWMKYPTYVFLYLWFICSARWNTSVVRVWGRGYTQKASENQIMSEKQKRNKSVRVCLYRQQCMMYDVESVQVARDKTRRAIEIWKRQETRRKTGERVIHRRLFLLYTHAFLSLLSTPFCFYHHPLRLSVYPFRLSCRDFVRSRCDASTCFVFLFFLLRLLRK